MIDRLKSEIPSACFVLERSLLRRNLVLIDQVQQQAGVKILLALKGFAMFSCFDLVRQYLAGTTASSLNEARLGAEEFAKEVHAYCTVYAPNEFDQIAARCSHISFNSLSELERYRDRVPAGVSIGLRVNPEYSCVKTDLYNPCIPGSRLGESAGALKTLPRGVSGLHVHNLCEGSAVDLKMTLDNVDRLFSDLLPQLSWLNLGGGHLMTRAGYDLDLLIATLKDFKQRHQNLEIILEPGSAVAWETGYLKSSVLDILDRDGVKILMLDVSVAAHMPDCLEMPYKARIRGAHEPASGQQRYRIGGVTCLAGDFMGDYSFDSAVAVGDTIIFEDMMHYTMVKTTMFNGVQHPSIAMIHENGEFELVREFSYADFRSRLS